MKEELYILSESELTSMMVDYKKSIIKGFLAPEHKVVEIAKGKLGIGFSRDEQWGVPFINYTQLAEKLENYEGDLIRFFVEVIK
jgi:hypothetical protein